MNLAKKIREYREKKAKAIKEQKENILKRLYRDWTAEETEKYNVALIAASAGWLGGNYTQFDCKFSILRDNQKYFTPEEIEEISKNIKEQKEKYVKPYAYTKSRP